MLITAAAPRVRLKPLGLPPSGAFWPGDVDPTTEVFEAVLINRRSTDRFADMQLLNMGDDAQSTHYLFMDIPENGATGLNIGQQVQITEKFLRGTWAVLPEGAYELYAVTTIKHHPGGTLAKVGLVRM